MKHQRLERFATLRKAGKKSQLEKHIVKHFLVITCVLCG